MKKTTVEKYLITNKNLTIKDAQALVKTGKVLINDEVAWFPKQTVLPGQKIRVKQSKIWVARSAYKLLGGLTYFSVSINNKTCLDLGSSTGGFTQVLLRMGAKKVYAVDVGYNQLAYKLRIKSKVIVMEKTNFRNLSFRHFLTPIDIIVADLSFISLKHVFSFAKKVLCKTGFLVVLIKPEFEIDKKLVKSRGVAPHVHHGKIIENLLKDAKKKGWNNHEVINSPLLGQKSKNTEYLTFFSH